MITQNRINEKGIKMKRLLIFGDSILKGVYYSDECGRHKLYGERLSGLRENGVEIRNCSVMGATIGSGEKMLRSKLSPENCDSDTRVIFEYGGNDCDFRWSDISAEPQSEHTPNTPFETFCGAYRECISYARELGAKVSVCSLVPLDSERYFRWISRNLNGERILSWLGDESMLYRWHEYYSRGAEKIASDTGASLIDLRTPFLLSHNYSNLLCSDGIHPTIEGHRMIDRLIEENV